MVPVLQASCWLKGQVSACPWQVASLLQNSQQALEPKGWLSDSVS